MLQRPNHCVQRVGDADDKSVRRVFGNALAHRFHHFEVDAQQVIPAHPRFARNTGGHDAHIGARNIRIINGALQIRVKTRDRAAFGDIKRLTLWDAIRDVENHHITQFLGRRQMGQCAADLTGPDQRDLCSCHFSTLRGVRISGACVSLWSVFCKIKDTGINPYDH